MDLANQLDISWYDIRVRLEMGYDPQMLMGIGSIRGRPIFKQIHFRNKLALKK